MPPKVQPKTREQRIMERWQELDWQQQMEARHAAERAEQQSQHDEFARRVQAARAAHAGVVHRLEMQVQDGKLTPRMSAQIQAQANDEAFAEARATIQGLDQFYMAQREQELAAEAEAERQRIAALTPRQVWMSTLSGPDRSRVLTWEGVNKMPYPVPGLE